MDLKSPPQVKKTIILRKGKLYSYGEKKSHCRIIWLFDTKLYLKHRERIRRNAAGEIDCGDEPLELRGGSKVAEIINNGGSLGLDEEDALVVAVDLNAAGGVAAEAASEGVEGDEDLGEGFLENFGIEESAGI